MDNIRNLNTQMENINIFSKISKLHVFLHHLDTKCYQRKRIIINLLISILKNTMKESKFTCMKYVNYLGMILFKDILSCNDFVFILPYIIIHKTMNLITFHRRLCPNYPENGTLCIVWRFLIWKPWPTLSVYNK